MKKAEREELLLRKLAEMKVESGFYADGIQTLGGVDEMGRGPLAGPVEPPVWCCREVLMCRVWMTLRS